MTRENIDVRARRLLTEHRVRLVVVAGDVVDAVVRGTGTEHRVRHTLDDGWRCSCGAGRYRRRCSHQIAVMHVTVPQTPTERN